MTEFGREADSLFINEDYKSAAAKYERATIVGRGTIDQMDEALARLLDEGRNALTEGDGVVARSKFSLAMMIDPSNQSARYGFKRAQTIETVLQLIESGRQHEKDDMLSQARDDYQAALQIDSDFEEARRALNRVSGLIKEKQFTELMSAGLTAFHNNDYALARTKLQQAKSLNPGSREVSDALLQVNQALRLARIDRLREEANKAEQSEDWPKALKFYLAVLEIDKNLQFAARGEKRAREQISIAGRLDFFLSQPQVLESDQQLKNAVLLMHEAREVEPRSRKLTARLKELEELIQIAQTPVVITIESDNLTQVAVYKVGKLGRFSQRKLKLRPGTYTVVGARDGYQDVRQKIIVKAGQQALRVTVKCRVKI
jgi:tetratricopeptide (TPR) repeat protein